MLTQYTPVVRFDVQLSTVGELGHQVLVVEGNRIAYLVRVKDVSYLACNIFRAIGQQSGNCHTSIVSIRALPYWLKTIRRLSADQRLYILTRCGITDTDPWFLE